MIGHVGVETTLSTLPACVVLTLTSVTFTFSQIKMLNCRYRWSLISLFRGCACARLSNVLNY